MTRDPMTSIRALVEDLSVLLAQWDGRDDSKAQPEVREAGSSAVIRVDALTRHLHRLRNRLVGELQASDAAAAARVDELLGRTDS